MFVPKDDAYDARIRASFERQAVMKTMGASLTGLKPGWCEITMPFSDAFTQQHGYLHAGVVTTISDSAAGYAAYSLMPANSSVLSIEFKQNLLSPAKGEKLIARGEVVRAGRTISITESRAYVEIGGQEKLVGLMVCTLMCMHDQPDTGG